MRRTTNYFVVVLALFLCLLFCCPVNGSAANNYISPVSTKHDDGRRVLEGFPDVSAAARDFFMNNGLTFEEIKKLYDVIDAGDKAREFTMDITGTKKSQPWILPPPSVPPSPPWILPPPPPSVPSPPWILPPPPPSIPSPSHASPLSHFVDTFLMMISTTITIIIFIMY